MLRSVYIDALYIHMGCCIYEKCSFGDTKPDVGNEILNYEEEKDLTDQLDT